MEAVGKKILFPALAIILGTLAALLVIEGAAKVVDVRQRTKKHQLMRQITRVSDIPDVRYEMVPGVSSTTPGYDAVVHINSLGFRGGEISTEKAPDTYRIAVLGDSISFARYLDAAESFPVRLEEMMNRSGRYTKRIEVINAGLSGRDTWEELALLEHRVLPLQPDLVLLQICMNDHIRLPFPDRGGRVNQAGMFGELAWWQYSSFLSLLDKRVKGFREYHVAALKKLGFYRPSGNELVRTFYIDHRDMIRVEDHWEEWSAALLKIRDLARRNGAEVMFVVFPMKYHIKNGITETSPELTRFAAERGIPFLDLAPVYAREGVGIYGDHLHPVGRGHKLAAKAIRKFIDSRILSSGRAAAASSPP